MPESPDQQRPPPPEPPPEPVGTPLEQEPEVGGRKGPEPVRYGDWEKQGRCIDF